MGYDLVVSDATERHAFGRTELDPDEQMELEALARGRHLPILASFPQYWDSERQIPLAQLPPLLGEIEQVVALPSVAPAVLRAVAKLRVVVQVAIQNGRPLDVVPD